jgi:hypothetical protein
MSEEQNIGNQGGSQTGDPPKRKRVPSQYANQIADFKNVKIQLDRITRPISKKEETTNPHNPCCWPKQPTMETEFNP